jgi:hypothetical protein
MRLQSQTRLNEEDSLWRRVCAISTWLKVVNARTEHIAPVTDILYLLENGLVFEAFVP